MKIFKKYIKSFLLLSVIGILFLFLANYTIENSTKNFVFDDAKNIPACKTGVLLGCSKFIRGGYKNPYFFYRIDATVELYKTGKIQYIMISGDNSRKNYSEPEDMQAELIARGIPADRIYLDFAGFRTLDSVVRADKIFGQKKFILISQKFHNERAVFLAQKNNLETYGFNAKDVSKKIGLKVQIREYFARVKVFVDLLLGIEPKFGGDKVVIP